MAYTHDGRDLLVVMEELHEHMAEAEEELLLCVPNISVFLRPQS